MTIKPAAPKPNLLERAIAAVAPAWALERAQSKDRLRLFGYDAANPGTLRSSGGNATRNGSPESVVMNRDREKLIWEARNLERNSPVFAGLLDRIAQYVCFRVEYKANTGDPKIDKEYQDYFHEWCGKADLTGRQRLRGLCRLAIRSMVRDGDMGFVITKRLGDIKLQAIEADRIGSTTKEAQPSDKMMGGVNIDDDGRPVSYRIFKRDIHSQYHFEKEVRADDFIHVFMPTRFDQYRGVSALAPVIADGQDAHELIGFEKQACKFQSSFSGFRVVKDPNSTGTPVDWDTSVTATTPASLEVQAGRIQTVTDTDKIDWAPGAQRPSGAFMQFHEVLIRRLAMGLNWPFEFLWNMSDLGGATARLSVKQAERRIADLQNLLVETILERVKNLVIANGIASKKLRAVKSWRSGQFLFGAWLTADVGYQTASDIQKIQSGLMSKHEFHAQNGGDFDQTQNDIYGELQRQRELSAERKIPLELVPGNLNPMASQVLAAMQDSAKHESELMPPPPEPPPGLLGQFGDKGIKQLLEINQQVGDGTLPRDAAVMQVSAIFGIDMQQADSLVPQAPKNPQKEAKDAKAA